MTIERFAVEVADDLARFGILAFTTGRAAGSFGTASDEPVSEVMGRWRALRNELAPHGTRLATASQVHASRVVLHGPGWAGWLRIDSADGHASLGRGTAMAVSVADCVPVFLGHPSGAAAVLHAGWRGTAAGILPVCIGLLAENGIEPHDLHLHLGPAICGRCYDVSPDVYARITGRAVSAPTPVDLRAVLADQGRQAGISSISASGLCTRCDSTLLFSHRGGDTGRQLGVIVARGDGRVP